MKTLMGSESAEYLTPGWILDAVEKVAPIALDPCAHPPCPQIALVPARVDTGWWRQMNPDAWCALSGRVKFLSCQHEWGVTNRKGYHCQHCDQYADEPLKTECPAAAPSETDPAPFPSAVCLMHADAAMRARFVQVFKEHGPIYVRAD